MSIPLHKIVLSSTVYIKNQFGNVGTGFLIAKKMGEGKQGTFLITNKHVLRENAVGPYTKYIDVRFYSKNQSKAVEWVRIPIFQDSNNFSEIVFMHPQDNIDIVGILISGIINQYQDKIEFKKMGEDVILTREIAQKELVDAGEDLLVLGYPAGIFSETNYLPLVKSGLLASSSSEDLHLKLDENIEIKGRIYLVDGTLFGGNSGGPVFVKPRWKAERKENGLGQTVKIGEGLPLYLLGVHSSSIQSKEKIYTRMFESQDNSATSVQQNAEKKIAKDKIGEYIELEKDIMLNLVFSAEYIKDIFDAYVKWYENKTPIVQKTEK